MREPIGRLVVVVAAGLLIAACGDARAADDGVEARSVPVTVPPDGGENFTGRRATVTPPAVTTTVVPTSTVAPTATTSTERFPAAVEATVVSTIPTERSGSAVPTSITPTGAPVATAAPGEIPVPSWPPYSTRPGLTEVAALTGRPATEAVAASPIMVVKIDNVGRARPQWELDRADVVFEENVEGATRFLALYHSDAPAEVGPVRSARTTDIDLFPAMNRPVLAWSGGNPGVTKWIDAADDAGLVVDVSAGRSNCYRREPSRAAPHNLVAATACVVRRGVGGGAGAAAPLWSIDGAWTPGALATTTDTSFEVAMDGGLRAGWTWDPATGLYLRNQNGAPHVAASGVRVATENVVVLTVVHRPSLIDARSPHAETLGIGPAVIHRDGLAIPATWVRPTTYDPFQFVAADGSRIPLQVGRTFVELAR